jgi:hypothetical protein
MTASGDPGRAGRPISWLGPAGPREERYEYRTCSVDPAGFPRIELPRRDHRRVGVPAGDRHRPRDRALAVRKDADGEVEVTHLGNLTDDEAIELGSVVGALIGLGIDGEEG